jgi:hypothetical protein
VTDPWAGHISEMPRSGVVALGLKLSVVSVWDFAFADFLLLGRDVALEDDRIVTLSGDMTRST